MHKAVVLSAGRGKRMGALTEDVPKPMIPVGGKPMLEHILDRLAAADFTQILLVIGHKGDQIRRHFAGYPAAPKFVVQDPVDGTASATLLARDFTGSEPFLLTFGDILMESHEYTRIRRQLLDDPKAVACAGVRWVDDPHRGAAVYEVDGVVTRIVEKPQPGSSDTHWNSAGLYVFRPAVYEELVRVERSSRGEFELTSAVSQLLHCGERILLFPILGGWGDIGTPGDLGAAERLVHPN